MEGVQPLDGNEGNAPGLRFPMNKLLLAVSVIQGLGLALCLTYVCLHFQASQVRRCTGHLAPSSSCWRHCQQLQTVPYTRADARFFLFLSLSVTAKCGETTPPLPPTSLFLPSSQQWRRRGSGEAGQGRCSWVVLCFFAMRDSCYFFRSRRSLGDLESLIDTWFTHSASKRLIGN